MGIENGHQVTHIFAVQTPKNILKVFLKKQKSGKVIVGEEMQRSKKIQAVEMFQKDKLLKKGHPENTLSV